eukprot:g6388.t1
MSRYFQSPANALRRAKELEAVGKEVAALDILQIMLKSRKHRTWTKDHELIMKTFVDISVKLRDSSFTKDGLHQYRNIAQQSAPKSLETIIWYLLDQSEKKKDEAIELMSRRKVNIEETAVAENALLLQATTDTAFDRAKHVCMKPWIKYNWDSFRTVLEILSNNQTLHELYHDVCAKAFEFLIKHNLSQEFKRLAETMRKHLNKIITMNSQASDKLRPWQKVNGVKFNAEVAELSLNTRFLQLETAAKLKLWHEAFRTVEDVYNIIELMKNKKPKAQQMALFYDKVSNVFWASKNLLFHAYCINRFYALSKAHNVSLTVEEKQRMASRALLAALCIPEETEAGSSFAYNVKLEKNRRVANLLDFPSKPDRSDLIARIAEAKIDLDVAPELRQCLAVFEQNFAPLDLAEKPYCTPLTNLLVVRMLRQLSKIYETLKIPYFISLIGGLGVEFADVEKLALSAVKSRLLSVHIDHKSKTLRFSGKGLQAKRMQTQLSTLSHRLNSLVPVLDVGATVKMEDKEAEAKEKAEFFEQVLKRAEKTHKEMLDRGDIIEAKKEEFERQQSVKSRREQALRVEQAAARRAEEQERLLLAQKARDEQAKKEAEAEQTRKENLALAKKFGLDAEAMKGKEKEEIMKEAQRKAAKEKANEAKQLNQQKRTLDYTIRALREAEVPRLLQEMEKRFEADQKKLEADFLRYQAKAKKEHATGIALKEKLQRAESFVDDFELHNRKRRAALVAKIRFCQSKLERARKRKQKADEEQAAEEAAEAERRAAKRLQEEEERRRIEEEEDRLKREQEKEERRREDEKYGSSRGRSNGRYRNDNRYNDRDRYDDRYSSRNRNGNGNGTGGKYVPPSARGSGRDRDRNNGGGSYVPPSRRAIFVPHFIKDIDEVSAAQFSLLWAVALIGCALTMPLVGWILDKFGATLTLLISCFPYTLFVFLMGSVQNRKVLLLLLYLLRLSGPSAFELIGISTINRWYVQLRPIAVTFFSAFSWVSIAIPSLIEKLIIEYGWRNAYHIWSFCNCIVLLLCSLFVRDSPEKYGLKPDRGGDDIVIARKPNFSRKMYTRSEAMQYPIFWVLSVATFFYECTWTGLMMHSVAIFQSSDSSWTTEDVSQIDLCISIASIFTCIIIGFILMPKLSKKQKMFSLAFSLILASLASVLATNMNTGRKGILYGLIIGCAAGIFSIIFNSIFADIFGREHLGKIQSIGCSAMYFGTGLGPLVFGLANYNFSLVLIPASVMNLFCAIWIVFVKVPSEKEKEEGDEEVAVELKEFNLRKKKNVIHPAPIRTAWAAKEDEASTSQPSSSSELQQFDQRVDADPTRIAWASKEDEVSTSQPSSSSELQKFDQRVDADPTRIAWGDSTDNKIQSSNEVNQQDQLDLDQQLDLGQQGRKSDPQVLLPGTIASENHNPETVDSDGKRKEEVKRNLSSVSLVEHISNSIKADEELARDISVQYKETSLEELQRVDELGNSALMVAAASAKAKTTLAIVHLFDSSASTQSSFINLQNKDGDTALIFATRINELVEGKHIDKVCEARDFSDGAGGSFRWSTTGEGSSKDRGNDVITFSSYAAAQFDIVKDLISYGANPNLENNNGDTVLTVASEFGQSSIVWYLLFSEANNNVKTVDMFKRNKQGDSPLMLASKSQYQGLDGKGSARCVKHLLSKLRFIVKSRLKQRKRLKKVKDFLFKDEIKQIDRLMGHEINSPNTRNGMTALLYISNNPIPQAALIAWQLVYWGGNIWQESTKMMKIQLNIGDVESNVPYNYYDILSPITLASLQGNLDILERGMLGNQMKRFPSPNEAERGYFDSIATKKDSKGRNVLMFAAFASHPAILEFLKSKVPSKMFTQKSQEKRSTVDILAIQEQLFDDEIIAKEKENNVFLYLPCVGCDTVQMSKDDELSDEQIESGVNEPPPKTEAIKEARKNAYTYVMKSVLTARYEFRSRVKILYSYIQPEIVLHNL